MREKKKIKNIIFLIIVLILIALNIKILIKIVDDKKEPQKEENKIYQQEKMEDKKIEKDKEIQGKLDDKLKKLPEQNRIKKYIAEYFTFIENKKEEDLHKAYDKLNENFKKEKFDTYEKFKEYIKIYPTDNIVLKYNKIDMQGEIFIVTLTIDSANDKKYKKKEQRIVVREKNLKDYTISFNID